ncbi:hypothetical protein THTE_1924 [Thermogutta terrifontis]|uniref:Uncharacterized protein n=1 Tax=Thermogutta terrifontis TaxID=1331910 RepID=A0A286REX9_9BACT|nr:hypothetical protein THTE_1924 [Thermogutta terrifontis]
MTPPSFSAQGDTFVARLEDGSFRVCPDCLPLRRYHVRPASLILQQESDLHNLKTQRKIGLKPVITTGIFRHSRGLPGEHIGDGVNTGMDKFLRR